MRILIIIDSLSGGGAERITSTLADAWSARGRELMILTFSTRAADAYPIPASVRRMQFDWAAPSTNIWSAVGSGIRRVLALRKAIRHSGADVVIGMMIQTNVLVALACLGLRVRTIGCERSFPTYPSINRYWHRLRRLSYPLFDSVVAQTEDAAAWLRSHIASAKVSVIPNPLKWPPSVLSTSYSPAVMPGEERKILLAVGRLEPMKGFDYLIDAFRALCSDAPEWDLVLVGNGPDEEALRSRASRLGISDRVYLVGRCDCMPFWYRRADVFVLPSLSEGFPNVLLEAMAFGLPVVASDCQAGPSDIIRDGVDGLLFPPGNVERLEAMLRQVFEAEPLRAGLGRRAVEVRERYSFASIDRLWDGLFTTLGLSE